MSFLVYCSPTSNITYSLHHLVNNKVFLRAVPLDLDKPLAVSCYKCWVEAKFLLTHLENPRTVNINRNLSSLISNRLDTRPPSRSNSHTLIRDPYC
jgi:hypothetical protein